MLLANFHSQIQCISSCSPSIGTYYRNLVSQCNCVIYINMNFDCNLANVLDILEHSVRLFELINLGQICFGYRWWLAILSTLNQHLPNQGFTFTDQIKNEPKLFGQSKIRHILKFRINRVSIYLELTKGKDLAPTTNRKMTFVIV